MAEGKLRILLVDDHEILRQGLKSLLGQQDGFLIVGEAATVADAIAEAARTNPDVAVLDVRLPDGSGVEACREIRSANPNIKVLMLTSYADDDAVFDSIVAGASGYLLKQVRAKDLVAAIEKVGKGESLLDPNITSQVMDKMRELSKRAPGTAALSEQEEKILALIARGKTNKEIASEMLLSDKTVKNYVSSLLAKLNVSRRSEAAAFYVQRQHKGGF